MTNYPTQPPQMPPTVPYYAPPLPPRPSWLRRIAGNQWVQILAAFVFGGAMGSTGDGVPQSQYDTVKGELALAIQERDSARAAAGAAKQAAVAPAAVVSPSAAPPPATPTALKIGQAARDGKFEFVVSGIECGKTRVGSTYLNETAQGQFCSLKVNVTNIGNREQSFFADNQYLLDAAGKKYSADGTATFYAAPDGKSWYEGINPGNSVQGAVIFDVPKGVTPSTAKLHDSMFSGGVEVSLQ